MDDTEVREELGDHEFDQRCYTGAGWMAGEVFSTTTTISRMTERNEGDADDEDDEDDENEQR